MCGIAVGFKVENAKQKVALMLKEMLHRGDITDPVCDFNSKIAFGTRRLKILDRERAIQPQWSSDEKVAVILNGQIYNYKTLRGGLEKKGIRFQTDCDTEVIANGLASDGLDFISKLNGMFAFVAIWEKNHQIIAVRDPLGIKPLYFVEEGEGLCFASEIKPLLRATEKGQVRIVPPGTILTENKMLSYKTIKPVFPLGDLDQNAKTLSDLLHQSVESQLPSDLECAVKFSGGIDSTLILHYAKKYKPNIKAYHISRVDGRDREYAIEYAEKTNTNLTLVDFQREEALSLIERVIVATETFEPNIIRNAIFSYLLSQKINHDGIKVALCGEGADELFCGYLEMKESAKPITIRKNFLKDLHKTQLQRVDRCAMNFELETRVPFLDARIIQFAHQLPMNHLIDYYQGERREKVILRKIYEYDPMIPFSIGTRNKVVFVDGAGMGDNSFSGPFFDFSKIVITDKDFFWGKKKFADFSPRNKEDVFYLSLLEKHFDLNRLKCLSKRPIANTKQFCYSRL